MKLKLWGQTLVLCCLVGACSSSPAKAQHVVETIPAPNGQPSLASSVPVPAGKSEPSPRLAVEAFVHGLMANDATSTYALLSDKERAATSLDSWSQTIGSMPQYKAFTVVRDDPVEVDATFTPHLDEDLGAVPDHALVHFATLSEGGGFRVSLAATSIDPRFPTDESGAREAALAWAKDRQTCATDVKSSFQYQGSLLGQPSLAVDLCRWSGVITSAGPSVPLAQAGSATAVRNAFGPGADDWSKVISVDGPRPLHIVVAPLGETWLVIAVSGRK